MSDGEFLQGRKAIGLRAMTAGPLFLGLATDQRQDGQNRLQMWEVTDRGYVRQAVAVSEPVVTGDAVYVHNADPIEFPPWADDSPQPLRHWFLCTQPDGVPGEIVARGDLEPREILESGEKVWSRPRQGEGPKFLPGDIVLTLGDAEIVEVPA